MEEKTKIKVHRLSWFIITLMIIFIPLIITAVQSELEIVDSNVYIDYYYESLDETSLDVEIIFNRNVDSGYATIRYFDSSNRVLETKRSYFSAYGKTAENTYINIDGKVASYEIVSFEFEPSNLLRNIIVYVFLLPTSLVMFISALLLSYKERFYNGSTISVYAGYFHHTLRVNGVKYDEHNTLISWMPIVLSTTLEDGTKIDSTISLTNRITIKINDRLFDK